MRVACRASAALLLAGVAGAADRPAPRPAFEEHAEVTRGIAIVRIDVSRLFSSLFSSERWYDGTTTR